MTLNQLKYFQTVARFENFHLAASELYISQPSLSRSIAALEKELGVILFEKRGRGIRLTKSGFLFLEYVDRILSEYEIAVYKMRELANSGGRIDVGYVFPLANQFIPRMVRKFLSLEENKNITFSFFQDWTFSILDEIKKSHLDVGFCAYVEQEEELEFFPVVNQELVFIAPLHSPLAESSEASIMELTKYPVIGYHRLSWLGSYTRKLYRRLGIQPEIVCECSDENAIQAMVKDGFGIALITNVQTLDENHVRILKISDMALSHQIYMVWMKNHYHIPAINRFVKFMKNQTDAGLNFNPES